MPTQPLNLTEGNVPKTLLSLAMPSMLGMSFYMIYDLVDLFWIGMISTEAIAGVTVFSALFWVVSALNDIIGQSSISLISQNHSRKDVEATNIAVEQTITFKFFVAFIAAALLALFMKPILDLFSGDRVVIQAATDYGYLRLFFLPVMFSSYSVGTILRCTGDAKTPMKIMAFASILNIILDPLLIFHTVPLIGIQGAGLGVFGAAVATVISESLAFVIGIAYVFSGKREAMPRFRGLFRLHWPTDIKLLTIGLPIGMESLLRHLSILIVLQFIAVYGTTALAAGGIGTRIFGFAYIPLFGLHMAAAAMIGQNLGINKIQRAISSAKTAGLYGALFMGAFGLVCVLFGRQLVSLFDSTPEIVDMGAMMLKFASIGLVPLGYTFGLSACFGGSGYNNPYAIASFIARWLIQLPLLLVAVYVYHLSIIVVWVSYPLTDIVESGILYLYYRQGEWKLKRVC